MISTVAIGFVTSLTLIVAIGAQNAFVLRQGIRRQHVLPVVLLCGAADAALISTGIAGLGAVVTDHPRAMDVARLGGAAFLLGYGLLAAVRAARPQGLTPSDRAPGTVRAVMLTCLGFTFLNPHVYLDTVVMLGSLANQHGADGRWAFGAGAVAASFAWFFALGFGAHRLARFFENPRSWRWLDGTIAAVMIAMGLGLAVGSG